MHTAGRLLAWVMMPLVLLMVLGGWAVSQPQVALRYDPATLTGELARTLAAHLGGGEICDPLPCWVEVQIRGVRQLEASTKMPAAGGGPFMTSARLQVQGTCPGGSYWVEAVARDRWWNRLLPFTSSSWLHGQAFTLCVKG